MNEGCDDTEEAAGRPRKPRAVPVVAATVEVEHVSGLDGTRLAAAQYAATVEVLEWLIVNPRPEEGQ